MSEVLWAYALLQKYQAYLPVLTQIEKDCLGNRSLIEQRINQLLPADEATGVTDFEHTLWKVGSCAGDYAGSNYIDWGWEHVDDDTPTLTPEEVEARNVSAMLDIIDKEDELMTRYLELFRNRR